MNKTIEEQFAFARAVRDPSVKYGADTAETRQRLGVYQQLVLNHITQFVDSAFPVLKSFIREEQWQSILPHFVIHHRCDSPYFVDISKAFLGYLHDNHAITASLPAFARDLAHYEWLEIDIATRQNSYPVTVNLNTAHRFTLSPLAEVVSYNYAVHQISAEHAGTDLAANPHHYCVYRDEDDEVQFSVLTPASALLLGVLAEAEQPLTETLILHYLESLVEPAAISRLKPYIASTLHAFCEKKIVFMC